MSKPARSIPTAKVISELIAAAESLIAAWEADEIGQIDGEYVDDLRVAVDQAKGIK